MMRFLVIPKMRNCLTRVEFLGSVEVRHFTLERAKVAAKALTVQAAHHDPDDRGQPIGYVVAEIRVDMDYEVTAKVKDF